MSVFLLLLGIVSVIVFAAIFIFGLKKIPSKMNVFLKLLISIVIILIAFIIAREVFVLGSYMQLQHRLVKCKEINRTFTYEGCSVNYTEYIKDGRCIPCGYEMSPPCEITSSFEINKKIQILQCLCNADKLNEAKQFRREYFNETVPNACENLPQGIMYM